MENPTYIFRETNFVLQLIQELQIKSRAVMSQISQKKEEGIFRTVYFVQREFFKGLCFISMYSVLNTFSEYTYFYKTRNITSYTLVACL